MIGARDLVHSAMASCKQGLLLSGILTELSVVTVKGGKIDYIKLRAALEEEALTKFGGRHRAWARECCGATFVCRFRGRGRL
jgi:hypothetical protein